MFKIYLGGLLLLVSFACNSQTKKVFYNFSEGFEECDLPILGEDLPKGRNISELEFNLFIGASDLWVYGGDFFYNTSVRFMLENSLTVLLYVRSFYPENIGDEKMEFVLTIFDHDGTKISSLPLHGIYGDESTFYGVIDKDYQIKINSQKYTIDNKSGESITVTKEYSYQICKDSGKIIELE